MRKMTYSGIILCKMQASLFANYKSFSNCSPYVFIRRFMNSDLAKRFDDTTVLLESSCNETLILEVDEQYGRTAFGKNVSLDKDLLYWVGYVYRYWSYIYEVPSATLFQHVQPKILIDRYPLYHSMDVEYVVERICEEEEIYIPPNKSLDDILDEFIKFHDGLEKK